MAREKEKQGAEEGKAELKPVSRPVGRGGVRGAHAPPIPPKNQKGPPDGIVKYLK